MLGQELHKIRTRLGWTQKELAEKIDFTAQQISNYESNRRPIPKSVELAIHYLEKKRTYLSIQEKTFVDQFVEEIRKSLDKNIIMIVLFGSKVRGDFDLESDIDLLIILKNRSVICRKKIFDILFHMSPYNKLGISPVIYSLSDFQKNERMGTSFIKKIKEEGVLL